MLFATDASPADAIVLAELLALRTIVLNLHFHLASGTPVAAETMQRLIERADQDKYQQASHKWWAADQRAFLDKIAASYSNLYPALLTPMVSKVAECGGNAGAQSSPGLQPDRRSPG